MAIEAGSARGSLDLNAQGFFSSIDSAISQLHNLQSASNAAAGEVGSFENSLSGAGGGLQGISGAASGAASGISDVGSSSEDAGEKTGGFGNKLKTAWDHMKNAIPDASTIASKLQAIGTEAQTTGKNLSKYITAPLAALGIYSVKTAMTFEKSMSQVQATMGATKEDMVNLEAAAKKMGETTQFTNTEAAQALNYLALAGYNEEQMIAALPNVLNLAAAGGMDLAEASDMLTDGLSALNLASSDSTELMTNMETMVDQMAKTASRSNTSVAQLGESILTVGGTATYLSGGLAEVNQVIGLLADRGIKASEAGTHLRNIILAMQPATDAAESAFIKVGLGVRDANDQFQNLAYNADGTMKPLSEIFQMLQEGMSTMTDMEKQQVLADIFHRTDLASANALIGTSAERWAELAEEIENSAGAGSQMAGTQLDNLSGKMTLLKSKIEGAATTIGEILAPALTDIVDWFGKWIDKFAELDPKTQTFIVTAGLIAAALGPVLTIFGKIVSGTGLVIKAVATMFTTLAPLVKSGVAALLSPATLGLGTVLAGVGAFIAGYGIGTMIYDAIGDEIDEVLHPVFDFFVELWDDIVEFFTESIPEFFHEIDEWVSDALSSAWEGITGFFTETVPATFSAMWELLKFIFSEFGSWIYTNVIEPIKTFFVSLGEMIVFVFQSAWDGIKNIWNIVVSFFQGIWNGIKSVFTTVVDFFVSLFTSAWDGIKTAWSAVIDFFQSIWDGITSIFSGIATWFSNTFKSAWDGIKNIWNAVTGFFSDIWTGIKNIFAGVGSWFRGVFTRAWSGIKSVWDGVVEFFSGLWEGVKSVFSTAATVIADAFSGAFKSAFNGVMTLVEGVVNFFVDGVNGVLDLINMIPGVDIPMLDRLSLPRLAVGIDYVPYDDYQALLHKGERVLTKEENEEYTNNQSSGGGDTYIFNSPEPIDEIEAANQLKRVKQELAEGF